LQTARTLSLSLSVVVVVVAEFVVRRCRRLSSFVGVVACRCRPSNVLCVVVVAVAVIGIGIGSVGRQQHRRRHRCRLISVIFLRRCRRRVGGGAVMATLLFL